VFGPHFQNVSNRTSSTQCCVCVQGVDIQAIMDDIRKLKIIVKGHERRIKSLEEQLALYDTQQPAEYTWLSVCLIVCLSVCVTTERLSCSFC